MKSTLNIHWKDWCWSWGPILWPCDAMSQHIGLDPDVWKDWNQEENNWQRMKWLEGITNSMDMNLSNLGEILKDREAWHAVVHGVVKSWTWLNDWTTTTYSTLKHAILPLEENQNTPHTYRCTNQKNEVSYQN